MACISFANAADITSTETTLKEIPKPPSTGTGPTLTWTLSQVKKITFDHNPDLETAKQNYNAATKGIGIAVAGYLPHVTVSGSYEDTTFPSPSGGVGNQLGQELPYTMVTASVNQTLFDFGKVLSRISENRSLSHASEQEAVALRNAIELAVERAFYNVQATEELVHVSQKGLEKYQETFRRTEVLVRTGSRPQFDLTQAKVQVAQAKAVVINEQNLHEFAKIALLNIMGVQDQPNFVLVDDISTAHISEVTSKQLSLPDLLRRAQLLRPEIKRQEYRFDAARSQVSEVSRDYLPSLFLQGWVGKFLPNYPVSVADSWGVGIGLTWHIFDGLETTNQVGQLAARADAEESQIIKNKLDVTSDVNRGYNDLIRSEETLKVAEEALDASKENLNLAQKRYDVNVATILELLIAENSLLSSEASAVTARYDHEVAIATLKKAVNGPLLPESTKD
jgi:outer membrane protein TolC